MVTSKTWEPVLAWAIWPAFPARIGSCQSMSFCLAGPGCPGLWGFGAIIVDLGIKPKITWFWQRMSYNKYHLSQVGFCTNKELIKYTLGDSQLRYQALQHTWPCAHLNETDPHIAVCSNGLACPLVSSEGGWFDFKKVVGLSNKPWLKEFLPTKFWE